MTYGAQFGIYQTSFLETNLSWTAFLTDVNHVELIAILLRFVTAIIDT